MSRPTKAQHRAFRDGYRAAYMGRGDVTAYAGELLERWRAGYAAGEKGRARRQKAMATRRALLAPVIGGGA